MGVLHATTGWSAIVTHDGYSEVDLGRTTPDVVAIRSHRANPGFVFVTWTPRQRMTAVTEYTGRVRADIPAWVFGLWLDSVTGPERLAEVTQTLRDEQIPASAAARGVSSPKSARTHQTPTRQRGAHPTRTTDSRTWTCAQRYGIVTTMKRLPQLLIVSLLASCASDAGPSLIDRDAGESDTNVTTPDGGPTPQHPDVSTATDAATDGATADADAAREDAEPVEPEEPFDCATLKQRADTSNPPQSASWRYGGGVGYPDAIPRVDECMTVVSTYDELRAALDVAQPGDIVYVADDARIDMTGPTVTIPGGVWLVSGRGIDGSAGGMLFNTEIVSRSMLQTGGPDVRVTGLRLIGPDPGQCPPQYPNACTGEDRTNGVNCRDCMPRPSGVRTTHDNLEVDNCEVAAFSYAGISATDSVGHRIHHNHLHHNQRQGLGYGLVLGRGNTGTAQALVDFNRMDYMRHAIAGSGEPGQDYEARDNLVLPHANGHVFDMHGENENTNNGSQLAGGEMLIHRNTVLVDNYATLVVRGRPDHGAWLYDNCLARSPSNAATQRFFTGKMYIDESPNGSAPNRYNQSPSDCEPVRWCMASGGQGPWKYLTASAVGIASLGFADFDGNGKTDVFRANGGKWQVVTDGVGSWKDLNSSSATLDRLRFGDFDGDGRDDVFIATGTTWRFSSGGSTGWQDLRAATERVDDLAFGDFDGDGKMDVFQATGTQWRVSYGGTSAWQRLNTSTAPLSSLRFGDFNGDGKTDVFSTSGGKWRWSDGGATPWADLNTSSVTVASLRFADVDGDGKTDALRNDGEQWLYSSGAATGWRMLRVDTHTLNQVAFADFDGDGTADIFQTGCH